MPVVRHPEFPPSVIPAQFRDKRIFDYLYRHAGSTPDKLALSNGNAGYSYRELLLQVEACARGLLALGVNKGDRVATLSPPHPDYFIIFLATGAIGGIWVGLNARYTRAELEHVIADSEPCVIFARTRIGSRDYREDLRYFQGSIDSVKHIVTLDEDAGLPGALSYGNFLAGNRGSARTTWLKRNNASSATMPPCSCTPPAQQANRRARYCTITAPSAIARFRARCVRTANCAN